MQQVQELIQILFVTAKGVWVKTISPQLWGELNAKLHPVAYVIHTLCVPHKKGKIKPIFLRGVV